MPEHGTLRAVAPASVRGFDASDNEYNVLVHAADRRRDVQRRDEALRDVHQPVFLLSLAQRQAARGRAHPRDVPHPQQASNTRSVHAGIRPQANAAQHSRRSIDQPDDPEPSPRLQPMPSHRGAEAGCLMRESVVPGLLHGHRRLLRPRREHKQKNTVAQEQAHGTLLREAHGAVRRGARGP